MVDLAAAKQREADALLVAQPATDAVNAAAARVREIRQSITFAEIVLQWTAGPEQVQQHRDLRAAVDDWERWATGKPVEPARLASMLDTFRSDVAANRSECSGLASVVERWAQVRGLDLIDARPAPVERSLGIEL
jgi:hypothetical protein